ncbi:MAG: sugar ABC transporter substrate-binding protein [Trueperaceae bacterium]|nr:sugar ABC transporter substrate-binding protein [Trueperaceae bacterium]HRQ11385.1 sugar ABC transporter substrate-binding protein [Trueperaceae bacterium]
MRKSARLLAMVTLVLALGSAALAQTVNYFSFTAGSDKIDTLEDLIKVFESENPGIKIKYTTADFGSYFTKLQTDFAAGTVADVFELNYENFVTFASRDTLLDLGSYLASSSNVTDSTFYPAALNAFSYEGKQLGLPITFSTVMLYYNKDLFDAAGVGYPTIDWTWDDVIAAAKAITNPAKRVWGISQPVQFWELYKVAAQAGGGLTVTPTVQIDTPENRAAAHYLVDKVTVEHIMPTDAEMSGVGDTDMFLNQQLGMIVTGIWMFDQFSNDATFNWDVAVEPGGVKKATHFFSNAAVVSRTSKVPEAAYKWVEFLAANPAVVEARIATNWELSALSLAQADALEAYLAKPVPANRKAVFESLEFAVNPPVIENQPLLSDVINQELEAARLGTKTVEQALADAQKRVEELVKK